ncbi:MAG: glycosyltransferase family 2 protein [Candidatus Adiutrix sp.]
MILHDEPLIKLLIERFQHLSGQNVAIYGLGQVGQMIIKGQKQLPFKITALLDQHSGSGEMDSLPIIKLPMVHHYAQHLIVAAWLGHWDEIYGRISSVEAQGVTIHSYNGNSFGGWGVFEQLKAAALKPIDGPWVNKKQACEKGLKIFAPSQEYLSHVLPTSTDETLAKHFADDLGDDPNPPKPSAGPLGGKAGAWGVGRKSFNLGPKVSVVVPNYNHGRFLDERLDSIYGQSYDNFEVILLDDGSTDNSLEILQYYQEKHPKQTTLTVNSQNSGGVFHQWKKGIKKATGDIVWIAESDDYCSFNFLETLVPLFDDSALKLAYANTWFVGECGNLLASMGDYSLNLVGTPLWDKDFVMEAQEYALKYMCGQNAIPNASGVIFRQMGHLPLLDDPGWLSMRLFGDWVFYLQAMWGGCLAYTTKTTNFRRIYSSSVTVQTVSTPDSLIEETQTVMNLGAKLYGFKPPQF